MILHHAFILFYFYIYLRDLQESIEGAIQRALIKQLLRPASEDVKILLSGGNF